MGLQASEQATQKQQREFEHAGPTLADRIEKSTFSTPYGVFATHRGSGTREAPEVSLERGAARLRAHRIANAHRRLRSLGGVRISSTGIC